MWLEFWAVEKSQLQFVFLQVVTDLFRSVAFLSSYRRLESDAIIEWEYVFHCRTDDLNAETIPEKMMLVSCANRHNFYSKNKDFYHSAAIHIN